MPNDRTPVLGLEVVPWGGQRIDSYHDALELEQQLSASYRVIDQLAGSLTGAFAEHFWDTGIISGNYPSTLWGPFGGYRFADSDRIITKVEMITYATGATGQVTRINPNVTLPDFSNNRSIYDGDNDLMLHLSGATGVFHTASYAIVSASWNKGEMLAVSIPVAASGVRGLTIAVHWKPSSSYYGG